MQGNVNFTNEMQGICAKTHLFKSPNGKPLKPHELLPKTLTKMPNRIHIVDSHKTLKRLS